MARLTRQHEATLKSLRAQRDDAEAALRTVDAVLSNRAALDGVEGRDNKLVKVFRELTRLTSDLAAMTRARDGWQEIAIAKSGQLATMTMSRDGWERDCKAAAKNYEAGWFGWLRRRPRRQAGMEPYDKIVTDGRRSVQLTGARLGHPGK